MAPEIQFDDLIELLQEDSFDSSAPALIEQLSAAGTNVLFDFERVEPQTPVKGRFSSFRNEVARVPTMDRAAELKFSMGIELLWMRLQDARKRAGFSQEEVERYPDINDTKCLNCSPGNQTNCFGCSPTTCGLRTREELRDRTYELVAARNEMVERHMHVVFHLLEKYRHVSIPNEDLVQEANESLFRAVEGFDFRRGFRFKTYGAYWINQAFLNAIYNQSRTVRVPAYIQKAMKKISRVVGDVDGGVYNVDAIADKAGVDRKLVLSAMGRNRFTLSLNKVVDQNEGSEMVDIIPGRDESESPELGENSAMTSYLENAVGRLSEREQEVVRMRFGLGGVGTKTLSEVGNSLGISLERVRQIQRAALDKIRGGDLGRKLEQFA
ncbi:MAG: sigma-70 family RNA polymerase sigma factor [Planctomycetes bacterium]|nr:sigma-70 family RNA polymerase sigma factor [Planctomycetota bacterium]MCP4771199.1 sigma-70 family RNA polymerase sigma factor [Planctomycetota bacterium]MCP4862074.1 sigma-70 family RNA polymerase sigma factor [Planctomycetota bacterium]